MDVGVVEMVGVVLRVAAKVAVNVSVGIETIGGDIWEGVLEDVVEIWID